MVGTEIDTKAVVSKVAEFERRLLLRPIRTLGLQWSEGFTWRSRTIESGTESVTVDPVIPSFRLEGVSYRGKSCQVEVIDLGVAKYATFVVLRIHNLHPNLWFDLDNLVSTAMRRDSPVFLRDEATQKRYVPVDDRGVTSIAPGQSETVLLAFEPFRAALDVFELHLDLYSPTGFEHIEFSIAPVGLRDVIETQLRAEWLAARMRRKLLQRGLPPRLRYPTPTPAGLRGIGPWWAT